MPATKKSLRDRYRHTMDEETRLAIYASLKWDRQCLHGKTPGYDPNLGDRRKNLRKYCAKSVVRLALGRYNAW